VQRYRVVVLIVVFGIVPVVAAFFVALSYLKSETASPVAAAALPAAGDEAVEVAPPAPPETRRVLAAARALAVGSLIGDEDLKVVEIGVDAVRRGHYLADREDATDVLRGYAVRVPIASGETVDRSSVVGPGERGFLAAVLGPGARAVTIRVGPATSHAGLIDPGDRVDVILSAELEAMDRERSVLARTIVEDVRVVAVDRRVGYRGGSTEGEESAPRDAEGTTRTEMITATLEVSPEQGDRLVLGEHEGKLSLAVRSLAAAVPRPSITAVALQDLLLSTDVLEEAERERKRKEEETRLRQELAALAARLEAEKDARKRLEKAERARLEEEERRKAAEEAERLRTAEEERRRLAEEVARLEERLRSEGRTAPPPEAKERRPFHTVRVFRGSEPTQEILFEKER